MTANRWKLAFLVLAIAFASLLAYALIAPKLGPDVPQDSVVLQVQKLSQLVTVRCRIERVVAFAEQKDPVGEESILLMVEGEVQAGIDLHHVTPSDVAADESGALTVTLPSPAIINVSLDESKTKVWDRHVTWWAPWITQDPELEHKARLKAVGDIRQAALDMGILAQSRDNAQSALRDLFGALGWKVNVKVRGLD